MSLWIEIVSNWQRYVIRINNRPLVRVTNNNFYGCAKEKLFSNARNSNWKLEEIGSGVPIEIKALQFSRRRYFRRLSRQTLRGNLEKFRAV